MNSGRRRPPRRGGWRHGLSACVRLRFIGTRTALALTKCAGAAPLVFVVILFFFEFLLRFEVFETWDVVGRSREIPIIKPPAAALGFLLLAIVDRGFFDEIVVVVINLSEDLSCLNSRLFGKFLAFINGALALILLEASVQEPAPIGEGVYLVCGFMCHRSSKAFSLWARQSFGNHRNQRLVAVVMRHLRHAPLAEWVGRSPLML